MGIKVSPREDLFESESTKRNEIVTFLFLAFALFIFLSLLTFDYNDLSVFSSSPNQPTKNFFGIVGAYFGGALLVIMGLSAYVIPALVSFWAVARFAGAKLKNFYFKFFGTVFLVLAVSATLSLLPVGDPSLRFRFGGMIGVMFSSFLVKYINVVGAVVTIAVLIVLSLLIATDFLIYPMLAGLFRTLRQKVSEVSETAAAVQVKPMAARKPVIKGLNVKPNGQSSGAVKIKDSIKPSADQVRPVIKDTSEKKAEPRPMAPKAVNPDAGAAPKSDNEVRPTPMTQQEGEYKIPPLSLLNSPPPDEERELQDDLTENSRILEEILSDFDIEAKVIEVNRGPVITRYELEPGAGVKVHKITSLGDNISLGMKAQSVRIVAPVPGKGTIGVEVPNSKGMMVFLKEILESAEYRQEESKLKMGVGKDIAGDSVVTDLGAMPHLLIAGATGSGKTVCVNSLIISILFNATPEDVKFIMVDPKKVELAPFNELPHLLCPVITDYKKVPVALDWLVGEMEKRYELFAKCGVRNIDNYNRKAQDEKWEKLYYIVVIIDELADLMMVAQQEIESAITRLAQLSRAVGIHMILATQRPSVDVITGVIKANFPARISFKVASKVDSRTVLDMNGADKLLGRGDMLFVEPGTDKPVRAQGSLVSDDEIEKLVTFIKAQRAPKYEEAITKIEKKQAVSRFQKDEIYEEAVRVVLETRQASVSMLQRKLGVGYTKAARLIDMMEDDGIVGPYQGSKPREILVENMEQLNNTMESQ